MGLPAIAILFNSIESANIVKCCLPLRVRSSPTDSIVHRTLPLLPLLVSLIPFDIFIQGLAICKYGTCIVSSSYVCVCALPQLISTINTLEGIPHLHLVMLSTLSPFLSLYRGVNLITLVVMVAAMTLV